METTAAPDFLRDEPIEVSSFMPTFLRVGVGLFAAVLLFLAFKELWRAVWPLSVLSLFFGFMLAGAVSVCGPAIVGVIWGPNERWIIRSGHLTIVHELRRMRRERDYPHTAFVQSTIDSTSWDSGPDTYYLRLTDVHGKHLKSPNFTLRTDAEAALARLLTP